MPVKDISTITSSNSACSMLIGLVTGPLLKCFGYRKVAFAAGLMFTTGIILTGFSQDFSSFILSYSILTGEWLHDFKRNYFRITFSFYVLDSASGYGLSTSSFSLALNTYFIKKRSKAAGTAVTITGLGPIVYPPLITALLSLYDVNGCALILAGVSLHILVGALLLQPVKYHLVDNTADAELENLNIAKQTAFQITKPQLNGCLQSNSWCDFFWFKLSASNKFSLQFVADSAPTTVVVDSTPISNNTADSNIIASKMNQRERYRFYGFDSSLDDKSKSSGEIGKVSGEMKSNDHHFFNGRLNGLTNWKSSTESDTTVVSDTNLKIM